MPKAAEQLQPDDDPVIQEFLSEFGQRQPHTIWRLGRSGPDSTSEKLYVSKKALEARLDIGRVRNLLDALFKDWDKPAPDAEYIRRHCLRTLAILICIGYGRMIYTFEQHQNLHDQKLPFIEQPRDFPSITRANLFNKFYEKQWGFCALPMQYKMRSRLSPDIILPVLQRDIIDEEGGSAVLYKIQIDEDYNLLQPQHDDMRPKRKHHNTFVLKTYRTEDARKYYENESDAFKHLRHGGRPPANIIAFYGGYELHNTYNIILEYADGGNLNQYMERTPPPTSSEELFNFWDQFFNIFHGIHIIHGVGREDVNKHHMLLGWHQDISPDNILVVHKADQSSPYDVYFKLADLGLSHFKKHTSGPSQATDKDAFGTRAYGAPETHRSDFQIENSTLRVKQDVDIWSIGCVTSEAATWVSSGWGKVLEYRCRRLEEVHSLTGRREESFHDGRELLQTVKDVHAQNIANCRRNDDLTEPIIQHLIPEMLRTSEELRSDAYYLYKRSKQMISKSNGASAVDSPKKSPRLPPRPAAHRASESGGSNSVSSMSLSPQLSMGYSPMACSPSDHGYFNSKPVNDYLSKTSTYLDPIQTVRTGISSTLQPPLGSSPNGSCHSLHSTQETLRPRGYSNSNVSASNSTNDQGYSDSKPVNDYLSNLRQSELSKLKDLSFSETDQTVQARQRKDWKPPPQLAVQEALQHLENQLEFPEKQRLQALQNRDHVFVIDKSLSARKFYLQMRSILEVLTRMINIVEPNGVHLYFTTAPKKKLKRQNVSAVLEQFNSAEEQENPDMRSCLAEILNDYKRKLGTPSIANWVKHGKSGAWVGCRKLSLYILTDGIWQPGNDLVLEISTLVDHLVKKELYNKQVGIEFIRFGSNPEAIEKLRRLDSGKDFNKLDLVDTTPANGNVYKMLLGSINDWFHADRDDDETAVRSPSTDDSVHYGSP